MFTQNYNLPRLLEKVAPHTGDNDLFQFSNMNRLQTLHTWKINCFSLCFDTERQFPRQLLTIYFLFTHFHCIVIIFDWIIFLFLFLDKESNECDSRRQRSQSIDVSSINLCRNSLPFCLFAFKFLFYFVYVLGTKTSRCGKKTTECKRYATRTVWLKFQNCAATLNLSYERFFFVSVSVRVQNMRIQWYQKKKRKEKRYHT